MLDGARQRARLLELIFADLLGPQTIVAKGLLPEALVPARQDADENWGLCGYAAELARCPDGVWRVSGDVAAGIGNQPSARLLEGAALACFLPALCRALLGETLRLASLPSRWLADPGALQEIAANLHRWAIVDAFGRSPAIRLAGMPSAQRIALQDRVSAAPWRFAARLLVDGEARRIALARRACGTWTIEDRDTVQQGLKTSRPSAAVPPGISRA